MTKVKEIDQFIATFDIEASNLDPEFGIVLCVCIKPWKEKVKTFRLEDYQHEGMPWSDDSLLVAAVIEELNKYGTLVAHFGLLYDRKFLNGRALFHRGNASSECREQALVSPEGKLVDTWAVAKRTLNKKSNSLDTLARFLGVTETKTILHPRYWLAASHDHDTQAMDYIVKHCVMDVIVLESLTSRMRELIGPINKWGSA